MSAFGAACLATSGRLFADNSSPTPSIAVFTKPFQSLNPHDTAALVAQIGFDGIECPVRRRGQVEPAAVADLLPAYAEALSAVGCRIHIIATNIVSVADPDTERILRTAANLGIPRLRLGAWRYDSNLHPATTLATIRPALHDIVQACAELGIQPCLQNHSGANFVGASGWDLYELLKDHDPGQLGALFDIGHASVEGGLSWSTQARLIQPYFASFFVKDFAWQTDFTERRIEGCPLGQGVVPDSFFPTFVSPVVSTVPIVQHHEYHLGDRATMITHLQRDLATLKSHFITPTS